MLNKDMCYDTNIVTIVSLCCWWSTADKPTRSLEMCLGEFLSSINREQ